MKRFALLVLLALPISLVAQVDNAVHVKAFPGATVGAKVTAAMASCTTNVAIPCILVIDPSLAGFAAGTLPVMCSHCYLADFRSGVSSGPSGVNGNPIAPSAVSTETRTVDCASYSSLNSCLTAASTYAGTNEAGSGHAVMVLLHDATYALSAPFTLRSGMQLIGVQPRLAGVSWQNPTPNGGTWINCGGHQCLNGGNSNGLTGVVLKNLGFTNFTNVGTFGGAGVNGLNYSIIDQVYAVGNSTCCTSDTGIVEYNSDFFTVNGLYVYNVNTGFSFISSAPNALGTGNSILNDIYVYTYPKSAANGNNTEPGILFQGVGGSVINLLPVKRPQVNTPGGDGTGDGILLSNSTFVHLYDADVETGIAGQLANAIHLSNSSGDNQIDVAITANISNSVQLDTGCQHNKITSYNPGTVVTFSGTASGTNLFERALSFSWGDTGISRGSTYSGAGVLIGNGTEGDGTGVLGVGTLWVGVLTGGNIYSEGNLDTLAVGTQTWGAYSGNVMSLKHDAQITADVALEAASNGSMDLGGYYNGFLHVFTEHLDQALAGGAAQFAGTCNMSSGTTCTFSIQHAFTYGALCFASPFSAYADGAATCNLTGATVTVTAPTSNSLGWQALLVGNPY